MFRPRLRHALHGTRRLRQTTGQLQPRLGNIRRHLRRRRRPGPLRPRHPNQTRPQPARQSKLRRANNHHQHQASIQARANHRQPQAADSHASTARPATAATTAARRPGGEHLLRAVQRSFLQRRKLRGAHAQLPPEHAHLALDSAKQDALPDEHPQPNETTETGAAASANHARRQQVPQQPVAINVHHSQLQLFANQQHQPRGSTNRVADRSLVHQGDPLHMRPVSANTRQASRLHAPPQA